MAYTASEVHVCHPNDGSDVSVKAEYANATEYLLPDLAVIVVLYGENEEIVETLVFMPIVEDN